MGALVSLFAGGACFAQAVAEQVGVQNMAATSRANTTNDTESAQQTSSAVPLVQEPSNVEPSSPTFTMQTRVRRVAVDVVVTDAKGRPVKDLTREDFSIFEDGVAQKVRSFDAHVLTGTIGPSLADSIHLPPNTFANLVRAPEGAPVVIILYDVLNTPPDAMPYAHQAMVKFIKAQKQGSRIAIFVLSSKLRMLQGFTDDETRLLQAINSKSARTQQSSLLLSSDASASESPVDPNSAPDATSALGASLSSLTSLETSENVLMQQERLEATEDAFAEIARFVSTLPGRKNLIWLSGSFPSNALPNSDPAAQGTNNEFGNSYQMEDTIKETNDLLNLNHVSVYPVDVRGLQVNAGFSAASLKGPGNRPSISNNPNEAAEHGTMDTIAEDTGGRAFYNTNGLQEAMQTASNEGSIYYTLTYAPTNAKDDGTLRKIKVQLRRPGYELAYRRSYFADDPMHPVADAKAAASSEATPAARNILLDAGMQHGAPISSELFFEVGVYPSGGAVPATEAEMEQLVKFMKVKKKDVAAPAALSVQHYSVDYAILGRQLEMPETAAGKYKTAMIFALAAFSPDGLIVNGTEVSVRNEIPEAQYQKIRKQGYHAKLNFAAPVEASALRIAVRDDLGNKIGSIEIPLPVAAPPVATSPAPAEEKKT